MLLESFERFHRAWFPRAMLPADAKARDRMIRRLMILIARFASNSGGSIHGSKDLVGELLKNELGISATERAIWMGIYRHGLNAKTTFEEALDDVRRLPGLPEDFIVLALRTLGRMALLETYISTEKATQLEQANALFGYEVPPEFRASKRQPTNVVREVSVPAHYLVLGCDPKVTDAELHKAYRKRARELHPDSVQSRGLSAELIELGEEQFKELQAAYEQALSERETAKLSPRY